MSKTFKVIHGHVRTYFKATTTKTPPLDPEMHKILINRRYVNGVTYLDAWRTEARQLLKNIASEQSWVFQKQHLLKMMVAANSWAPLREAVGNEKRAGIWKSYVQRADEFTNNPADTWFSVLQKTYMFALLQYAVCFVIAKARAYGIYQKPIVQTVETQPTGASKIDFGHRAPDRLGRVPKLQSVTLTLLLIIDR
jgi:hypothetical protein